MVFPFYRRVDSERARGTPAYVDATVQVGVLAFGGGGENKKDNRSQGWNGRIITIIIWEEKNQVYGRLLLRALDSMNFNKRLPD